MQWMPLYVCGAFVVGVMVGLMCGYWMYDDGGEDA